MSESHTKKSNNLHLDLNSIKSQQSPLSMPPPIAIKGNHNLKVSLKSEHFLNLSIGPSLNITLSTSPFGHIAFYDDSFFL
jgi:hypothetical protein